MKNIKNIALLTLGLALANHTFAQTKPVQGTWINLPYQDVRNKYMNPSYIDYTTPEFWEAKIKEQAELGMKYVVIMAVANEEKAFYPSTYMQLAYDKSKKSPLDAIMDTAAKYGVNVFLSCGWAVNQDDNISDPKIRAMQLRIMEETAKLYKDHSAFYGWYLPVEDSMEPILSDHAVDAVNFLTNHARGLTPSKKIMISPYGVCYADLDSPKFGEQIKKLKVDIIAYQDEVGCVREPQPLPRAKVNFKKIGKIHQDTNIDFWMNVESFTWEKADNSRESALIPAAFPRYLAQMTSATEAGAKEIISFSTYGIFEKDDSPFPIGQPKYSNQVVHDYNAWRQGDKKWKLLEASFRNDIKGLPISKIFVQGNSVLKLSDGVLAEENDKDNRWYSLGSDKNSITVNLTKKQFIKSVGIRFLNYMPSNIALPEFVHLSIQMPNRTVKRVATIALDQFPNNRFDAWIDLALFDDLNIETDSIIIEADSYDNKTMMCDEILVFN